MCLGSSAPKVETPPQMAASNEQDAAMSAAHAQAKKRQGFGSTMLTSGGTGNATTRKTSLLGGSPM